MPEYVSIPTITDPDALAQDSYDFLETKAPNWQPHDGQLDTWIIAATARMIATLNDTMTDVEARIFRYFGANVLQIPPEEASAATSTVTFNLADSAGHVIPAGTALGIPNTNGELLPFETKQEVVVKAGSNKAEEVAVVAIEPGAAGSGIGVGGTVVTLLDELSFVTSVTLHAATSGGQDAEEDGAYLSRLVAETRLLAPRPIIPSDFAELARTVPGVHRALALNGYNPENGLFTNERTVSIAAIDEAGNEVNGAIKKLVEELLLAKREVNFIVKVINATYTTINVEFEIKKWPEWNSEDVKKRCEAAVASFLSPAEWGQPPFGDRTQWYQREKVKLNDVVAVLGQVQGVEDVLKVKLQKEGGLMEEKDITLPGVAALPRPGTQIGIVT